ncbi:transcriptional regulator [Bradyrhizobium sp. C-145]|uniref:helix-turn-helix transcriptional regulator n=1 Tax=Bradyrhizobium sp. C-145 TaxID=574727 RepID=UPI00201B629C|nr:transcriptional regulator [Bradyrhizobium sp. C-145]UQR67719.1 transcriptional regulator [Bradyrhizobium sp. C-145]
MTDDLAQSDIRMLSFDEWCQLNSFSRSTGQRLLRDGKGPQFVRISARRIGVTIGENRRWLASRMTSSAA